MARCPELPWRLPVQRGCHQPHVDPDSRPLRAAVSVSSVSPATSAAVPVLCAPRAPPGWRAAGHTHTSVHCEASLLPFLCDE